MDAEIRKKIAVLQTLGRLIMAPDGADQAIPGSQTEADSHVFSAHTPLWAYSNPIHMYPLDPEGGTGPCLFRELPPETGVAQALEHTRILVFLGATPSRELGLCLANRQAVAFVVEPEPARFAEYLSGVDIRQLSELNIFFLVGRWQNFVPPLSVQLPQDLWNLGFPVFFIPKSRVIAEDILRETITSFETLYYRHRIYPAESQENINAQPYRHLKRELSYDHTRHVYRNCVNMLRSGSLADLAGRFAGKTALLCAAGPALERQTAWIAGQRRGAVLIAVNSALKHLLKAGIEPDFVVINDTSVASSATLEGLPPLPHTALVSHVLSGGPWQGFGRRYYFGNYTGQPFPKRDSLLLHGSVITTAFSLAECLGCSRVLLAGAQLSFPLPYEMGYCGDSSLGARHRSMVASIQGSLHPQAPPHFLTSFLRQLPERVLERLYVGEPIGRWPQFYPLRAADGSQVYATLNFLDVAQWFLDRIRMSGIEVVNTVPESILKGDAIRLETDPVLPEDPELPALLASLGMTPPPTDPARIKAFLLQEVQQWRALRALCEDLLVNRGRDSIIREAQEHIRHFDQNNVSYLLQRFGIHRAPVAMGQDEATANRQGCIEIRIQDTLCPGQYRPMQLIPGTGAHTYGVLAGCFVNSTFCHLFQADDPVLRHGAVVYYYFWLREMCVELIDVLKGSLMELKTLGQGG